MLSMNERSPRVRVLNLLRACAGVQAELQQLAQPESPDEPAATTQAAERLVPSGGADILDDDIDAAFVGERADLL